MKGTEVSLPLQRSPGRAGLSVALRPWAPSLRVWAAGLGCLQTLGTLFLHGTGKELPARMQDVAALTVVGV